MAHFVSLKIDLQQLGYGGTVLKRERIVGADVSLKSAKCTVGAYQGGPAEVSCPRTTADIPGATARREIKSVTFAGDTSRDPRVEVVDSTGYDSRDLRHPAQGGRMRPVLGLRPIATATSTRSSPAPTSPPSRPPWAGRCAKRARPATPGPPPVTTIPIGCGGYAFDPEDGAWRGWLYLACLTRREWAHVIRMAQATPCATWTARWTRRSRPRPC